MKWSSTGPIIHGGGVLKKKDILLPTGGQEALVDVTTVLAPDEYQKNEQQTFEQHQRVEYVNLESVEADKVQCVVQGSNNHGAQVRQWETVVEYGERVELGERRQTV